MVRGGDQMDNYRKTDDEIVDLYFARDEEAIRESDYAYGKMIHKLSFRILANREDAEENKDDTYLTAWNAIPPVKPISLGAFLMKICRNHAIDRLNRKTAKKRSAILIELSDELADCIPGGNVEDIVEEKELGRLLSVFLESLPVEERYIMTSRCFFMKDTAEIASVLHCSQGRVRTILYRTRLNLRKYLEECGY